jgi:hypothetical protein
LSGSRASHPELPCTLRLVPDLAGIDSALNVVR